MVLVAERVGYCNAEPRAYADLTIEEHHEGGRFEWDKEKQADALYVSCRQKQQERITGEELRVELGGMQVLNAGELEHLFANQHAIPEAWKDKVVFFWGTIYRRSDGRLCVRCLYWDGRFWHCDHYCLDQEWDGRSVAALRAT